MKLSISGSTSFNSGSTRELMMLSNRSILLGPAAGVSRTAMIEKKRARSLVQRGNVTELISIALGNVLRKDFRK
jgi:hypothetical protein